VRYRSLGGRKIDALADRRALDLVVDDLLPRALGGGLRQAGLLAGLALLAELDFMLLAACAEAAVVRLAAMAVGPELEAAGAVRATAIVRAHRAGPRSWFSIQLSTARRRNRR
jgi:hypothetical protein